MGGLISRLFSNSSSKTPCCNSSLPLPEDFPLAPEVNYDRLETLVEAPEWREALKWVLAQYQAALLAVLSEYDGERRDQRIAEARAFRKLYHFLEGSAERAELKNAR